MINRAKMPRQLRGKGGITNVTPRTNFFLGGIKDRIRKLIPNEIADVATKVAPFVAPFNPAVAGLMRGIGRFDQRGSISDAFKQGLLTTAAGAGARYLGGATDIMGGGIRGGLTSPLSQDRTQALKGLFQGKKSLTEGDPNFVGGDANKGKLLGTKSSLATTDTKGIKSIRDATGLFKDTPILKDLPSIVQQQILVGGASGALTYIYQKFLADYPPIEAGEDATEYYARRREKVGGQMKAYFDNYFKFDKNYSSMSEAEKQAFIDRVNVKDGGRIGLANGNLVDPRMKKSLAENVRRNNAARIVNQMSRSFDFSDLSKYGISPKKYDPTPGPMRGIPAVKGMREKIIQDIMSTQQPYSLTPQKPPEPRDLLTGMPESMMLPNMADGSMRSLAEEDAIRDKVLAAQAAMKPTYQEALMGESWETLSDNDQYRIAQDYPGETPPRRNPNFVPNMNQGGRVGLMGGTMPTGIMRSNKAGVMERDYRDEGGFVPVGIKEKADDVPAMLSKNEFVMTANAVRGAGNGSIEKGAQRMYDTMKNLEKRVV